jgi:predicted regulator of Ras-like GTPase activity (Roadblock/LC7/MglB family)
MRNNTFKFYDGRKGWKMDSKAMGAVFLPVMETLQTRVPNLTCAVLCQEDGWNLCSLGLNEDQVGKMAAMASSLFSIGETSHRTVRNAETAGLDLMILQSGACNTIVMKINRAGLPLLLWVSAESVLGGVIMGAKRVAGELVTAATA